MDIWVTSNFLFWLLWITLLWISCENFCVEICFHSSWVYTPRSRILVHIVTLCLTFWGTAIFFQGSTSIFIPSGFIWMCQFFQVLSCQHMLLGFLTIIILVGMKWYAIMVIIYISLMTNDAEQLFMYLFSHLYILPEEVSVHMLWPFLNWVIFVLVEL